MSENASSKNALPAANAAPVLLVLYEQGLLSDLDVHFARFMNRLAGRGSPELALAAALASHASGQGDICINLRQWARRRSWGAETESAEPPPGAPPPVGDWLASLRASSVVGHPGERQPLVLDRRGRLYLYRYWEYEQCLADDLLRRSQ
ncbi:MAG: hypothetical protein ABTR27_13365, partial [Candidatus Competibacter phosphatis]